MIQENIRNFVIISHIDHGKSTLADRFLELTKTVPKEKMRPQFLDQMDLERERGITIKMQPVRMRYLFNNDIYLLNLIDTPGHVDFSYEVSRVLRAVEGAILLVDAVKGIQAQTFHHLKEAKRQNLVILPVVNKIDLPQADVKKRKKEISQILNIKEEEILEISAKLGINIEKLLKKIIEKIPPPKIELNLPFKALIFDFQYDPYKGVIAFVRIFEGKISQNEEIYLLRKKIKGIVKEIGYFLPQMTCSLQLKAGEIGYIAIGIKDPKMVRVGETITNFKVPSQTPLPGYQEPKPVVFISVFAQDSKDFDLLKKSLSELNLTDPAFSFELEKKSIFGKGFKLGFLGSLHAQIILERLKREFGLSLIISKPQVSYKIINQKKEEKLIFSAQEFPENLRQLEVQERWVILEITSPYQYFGAIKNLLENIKGELVQVEDFGEERLIIKYKIPLRELMTKNFYDSLKSVSQGFASLNWKFLDWRKADLVKMEIFLAHQKQEILSQIVPKEKVWQEAKKQVLKLKEILPREQFSVTIQAKVGGKVIARETLPALKKDVIASLYGGDYTRKRKLIEKQKKGKQILKKKGRIRLSPEIFFKMFTD